MTRLTECDWDLALDQLRSCVEVMENFSSFSSSCDVTLQVLKKSKLLAVAEVM